MSWRTNRLNGWWGGDDNIDPELRYGIADTGRYYLGVSGSGSDYDPFVAGSGSSWSSGEYDLHIGVSSPYQTIFNETFDTGAGSFGYVEDAFRGTNQPAYADGEASGGVLNLALGGVDDDDITNMSGRVAA